MSIIAIGGPTATGKTALAVKLAKMLDGEVLSCDSMQVYRGMDIGTAKPTEAEMQGVPHHMISVADPSEAFSAGRYLAMAEPILRDLLRRGKTVLIVGGTGLYMDALLQGADLAPAPSEALREDLSRRWDECGAEAMLHRLREVDAAAAATLHFSDKKRILRALEVYESTGEPMSVRNARLAARGDRYHALRLNLTYSDRAQLYEKIDRRVDAMLEKGLMDEVRTLEKNGFSVTARQALGYKEFFDVLHGTRDLASAAEAVKLGSRRYAKRQLTWFRRHPDAVWLDRTETDFSGIFEAARRKIAEFDR